MVCNKVLSNQEVASILSSHKSFLSGEAANRQACFSGYKLENIDFTNLDLSNVNFSNASLMNVNFKNCILDNATFENSSVSYLSFKDCSLREVNSTSATLNNAEIWNCDFTGAILANIKINFSNIRECFFCNSDLHFSHWVFTEIYNSSFIKAQMSRLQCGNDVHVKYCNFTDTNLNNSDCQFVYFNTVSMRNAHLKSADFTHSKFSHVDFTNATIFNTIFSNALIENALFDNETLRFAYFDDACIKNCDFSKIDISKLPMIFYEICPKNDFVGWKLCRDNKVVKLLIPEEANKCHGTSRLCRCDKVKVLDITDYHDSSKKYSEAKSLKNDNLIFKTGEEIVFENYNKDRWMHIEDKSGISFYLTEEELK